MITFDDADDTGLLVRLVADDPVTGERGRMIGWQGEGIALVMWPGNDHPQEEPAADLVAVPEPCGTSDDCACTHDSDDNDDDQDQLDRNTSMITTDIPATVADVSRAVQNLAAIGHRPGVWEDDDRWGVQAMRDNAAVNIVRWLAPVANLRKINRRDVGLIMASHGAPAVVIVKHAAALAKMIKRYYAPQHDGRGRVL